MCFLCCVPACANKTFTPVATCTSRCRRRTRVFSSLSPLLVGLGASCMHAFHARPLLHWLLLWFLLGLFQQPRLVPGRMFAPALPNHPPLPPLPPAFPLPWLLVRVSLGGTSAEGVAVQGVGGVPSFLLSGTSDAMLCLLAFASRELVSSADLAHAMVHTFAYLSPRCVTCVVVCFGGGNWN